MASRWHWAFALLIVLGAPQAAFSQQQSPAAIFERSCATCHGNPNVDRAPDTGILRRMTPDRIYAALTTGAMSVVGRELTDAQKRAVSEYLSERKLVEADMADARFMPNKCPANSAMGDPAGAPSWNGWADLKNTRLQPTRSAGLTADQIPRLRLKWAFGLPGATVAYGQPTPVAGRVFVSGDTGYLYALDSRTGCVYWSFQAQAGVRNAVSIGPREEAPGRYAAYFGDMRANVYALDATTGELLWRVLVEDHPLARITGAPKLHGDRLYVPVSSWEESSASSLRYQCCTFRGSVVALDIATGRRVWKTYTIPEPAKPVRTNSLGTRLWAPAGAAVWSSPTIDEKRAALYVTTGNAYTSPAATTSNALLALDLQTGAIRWSVQATPNDAWIVGCPPGPRDSQQAGQAGAGASNQLENCPDDVGPDYDFAASPMLQTLPDGQDIVVTGQKSGTVAAWDVERKGAQLWNVNQATRPIGPQGEIVWGGATDGKNAYFGVNSSGALAVEIATGSVAWYRLFTPAPGRVPGNAGPVTLIPGVVFVGGWDGVLRALSTETGQSVWEFDTLREFPTVNGVQARGGSMGGAGPTVAGGMVFVSSGYIGVQRGTPGNVVLAFTVE